MKGNLSIVLNRCRLHVDFDLTVCEHVSCCRNDTVWSLKSRPTRDRQSSLASFPPKLHLVKWTFWILKRIRQKKTSRHKSKWRRDGYEFGITCWRFFLYYMSFTDDVATSLSRTSRGQTAFFIFLLWVVTKLSKKTKKETIREKKSLVNSSRRETCCCLLYSRKLTSSFPFHDFILCHCRETAIIITKASCSCVYIHWIHNWEKKMVTYPAETTSFCVAKRWKRGQFQLSNNEVIDIANVKNTPRRPCRRKWSSLVMTSNKKQSSVQPEYRR